MAWSCARAQCGPGEAESVLTHVGRSARRVSVVARGVGGHGLATSHNNHESRRRDGSSVFRMRECTSFSASLHFP